MPEVERAALFGVPRAAASVAIVVAVAGLASAAGVVSAGSRVEPRGTTVLVALAGAVAGLALGALAAVSCRGSRPIRRLGVATTLVIGAAVGALLALAVSNEPADDATGPVRVIDDPTAGDGSAGGAATLDRPRDERLDPRSLGDLEGTLVLVAGLLGFAGAAVFFARRSELRPVERSAVYLASGLQFAHDTDGDEADPERIADALELALAAMLSEDDPRLAIRAAYGRLLAELDRIGFGRRHYEGPAEHLRRFLGACDLPPGPVVELVELFEVARFSDHRLDRSDAERARAALRTCLAHIGRVGA